jgi:hypothetical protein
MSDDRGKLTFSERDRRRREGGGRDAPRGRAAKQEQARASEEALKEAGSLFSLGQGGAEGEPLVKAIRDLHGTPDFLAACRAYREQIGVPRDPALLGLFLDTADRDLVVEALQGLLDLKNAGSLEVSPGLKSQLRVLEQDRDDTVAGISEDLLEA